MDVLGKTIFTGTWKSFKFFKHTGDIKFYTPLYFKEFDFRLNGLLTIKIHNGGQIEKLAQTDQWTVEFKEKRHYLKIPLYQLLYEIVTINHTILVLLDTTSVDKLFLAKDPHWSHFLQSNKALLL